MRTISQRLAQFQRAPLSACAFGSSVACSFAAVGAKADMGLGYRPEGTAPI
jgi:hypothetical protein